MSTQLLSLNKNDVNAIERDVSSISVGVGSLSVVPRNGKAFTLSPDDGSRDVGDVPLTLTAIEGCNYCVNFTEPDGTEAPTLPREVPASTVPPEEIAQARAERGDSADSPGNTGSYESRTVKETKPKLIKALRG
jgi:hypothetical protein